MNRVDLKIGLSNSPTIKAGTNRVQFIFLIAAIRLCNESRASTHLGQMRQSDYKIALVSAASGTIRVKDELKFTFDIAARKQE